MTDTADGIERRALRLRGGLCPCGRHSDQRDHDEDARRAFRCAADASDEQRYESVVASAGLLGALGQFFPLKTATEVFAQGAPGALEKKALKLGFIPITCATPIT